MKNFFNFKSKSKTPKYRNKRTSVGEIKFDSRLEATHYQLLKNLEDSGKIKNLELQPKFDIHTAKGRKATSYKPDFKFDCKKTGRTRYVDSKGKQLLITKIKIKFVEDEHDIAVELWFKNRFEVQGAKFYSLDQLEKFLKTNKKGE